MSEEHDIQGHLVGNPQVESVDGQSCREALKMPVDEMAMLLGQMHKLKDLLKDSQQKVCRAQEENTLLRQQLLAVQEQVQRQRLLGGQVLEDQVSSLKRQLAESQVDNGRYRQRLEKLSQVVLERERKIVELQQYESNFRKIGEQRLASDALGERQAEHIRALQKQKEQLNKELEESQQHAQQLERVIRFLRERQEEAQLETNQFRDEFQKSQVHMNEQTEVLKAAEKRSQELELALEQEKGARNDVSEELQTLYSQFETLKKMLAEANEKLSLKSNQEAEKNEIISTLTSERARLETALNQMTDSFQSAQSAFDEVEARLKMAQQHLAKKVKETSDLNDRIHSQDLILQDLQNQLNLSRARIAEQQQIMETQFQQEKRLQDQLIEASKSAESIVTKWEEKYFKVYEKWQDNELKLKDLKKVEEKFVQMQNILSNIGGLFGPPLHHKASVNSFPSKEEERDILPSIQHQERQVNEIQIHGYTPIETSSKTIHEEDGKRVEKEQFYHNLFEMPKQLKRPKYNLFD